MTQSTERERAEGTPGGQTLEGSNSEQKRRRFPGFLKHPDASSGSDPSSVASRSTVVLCKPDARVVEDARPVLFPEEP